MGFEGSIVGRLRIKLGRDEGWAGLRKYYYECTQRNKNPKKEGGDWFYEE